MNNLLGSGIADRRVTEWLLRYAARHRPAPPKVRPATIAISREMGSGTAEITAAVRAILGEPWQVWDAALLDEVARRSGTRLEMLQAMDEKEQSQIELTIRSLVGAPVVEEYTYRHHLAQVMLTLAKRGDAIIVGRGAACILRDALKVRLRAAYSFRVENSVRAHGWSREEAERRVHASDRERRDFIGTEFGHDIDAVGLYDMTLSTDTLGVPAVAAAIAAATRACFQLEEHPVVAARPR
jgi:Cytidylate kinase-like family